MKRICKICGREDETVALWFIEKDDGNAVTVPLCEEHSAPLQQLFDSGEQTAGKIWPRRRVANQHFKPLTGWTPPER